MTRKIASRPRVGYLVSLFPCWSETFILREILALKAQGLNVQIFSLRPPSERLVHDTARALLPDVVYPPSAWHLFWSLARTTVRHPLTWARLVVEVIGEAARRGPIEIVKACYTLAVGGYFAQIARDSRLDHLHAHWATYPALAARAVRRLRGPRYTVTAHAHDLFRRNPYLTGNLHDAEAVVTISNYNRQFLETVGIPADRVRVVRCGLDLAEFSPHRAMPESPAAIVAVGRLEPIKGLGNLIVACGLLKQRGIKYSCEIIGDGSLRQDLERQIADEALQDHVRLAGALAQSDVRERLSRAEVFALPSVRTPSGDQDGIPVALMEAMALGVPVVTTRVSGIPELVVDGESGLLVHPDDPTALADALEGLLGNPALREIVAAGGRAAVQARHDILASVTRLKDIFADASRPRVVYVIDELEYGGTQRQLLETAIGLRTRGWDVSVVCIQPILDMLQEFRAADIPVHLLTKRGAVDPRLILALRALFTRLDADVIHAFSPIGEVYAGLAARLDGRPFVASLRSSHEALPAAGRIAQWLSFRLARVVVANSLAGVRWAAEHRLAPRSKLRTVPNAVPARGPATAPRQAVRERLGLDDTDLAILAVGRLVFAKGYESTIEVFDQIRCRYSGARLLIVGEGPLRPCLETLVSDRGLGGTATFLGARTDLPNLLSAADIYLNTSHHEGMSNSLMEAMAAGLPVVATAVGGTPELIQDGESGYLFHPQRQELAVLHLSALIEDAALRSRLGASAQRRVSTLFSAASMIDRLESVYQSLLRVA